MTIRTLVLNSDNIIENIILLDSNNELKDNWLYESSVNGYVDIGHFYDSTQNAVYAPEGPFKAWILNTDTWQWEPPYPNPDTALLDHDWDSDLGNWRLVEQKDSTNGRWYSVT